MKTTNETNVLQQLEDAISEFGIESMEVAELFLEMQDSFVASVLREDDDAEVQFHMPTAAGLTLQWPSALDWYIFSDSSLTGARVEQIQAAYSFAMPTWVKTNPEALVSVQDGFGKVVAYYRHIGDFEEWEDFNLRVLNIFKTLLGHNHRMVMDLLAEMGEHYLESGILDDASACFNEALTICEADPDLKMSESPWLIMNSAAMACRRGEFVVARLLLDQVLERLAEAPTMNHVVLLEALANYAAIFRSTRNLAEFDRVSLQAEEVAREVWKSEPGRVVSSVLALIRSNEELGRSDVADRLSQWIVNEMESTPFSGDDIRGYGLVQRVFLHDCHECGLPASIEMIRPNIVADMAGRASI